MSDGTPMFYDTSQMSYWQSQRIDLINGLYGKDYFKGKTVLEVAAAWGHIGSYFERELGAIVTCTDHYDKWVDIIKERHPNITAFVQNVNDPWPTEPKYDVLIHMGVIYHQPAHLVEIRLREACKICNELILETSVNGSTDAFSIDELPKPEDLWEPIGTEYCNPSVAFIDRILSTEGFHGNRVEYNPNRVIWFMKKS